MLAVDHTAILLFDLPIVVVLADFPVVCWKVLKRTRGRVQPGKKAVSGTRFRRGTDPKAVVARASDGNQPVPVEPDGRSCCSLRRFKSTRGILALSVMTLMVFIVYFPEQMTFTVQMMFDVNIDAVYPVVLNFYLFSTMLDSVLFVLTLTELRAAFYRTYFFWM